MAYVASVYVGHCGRSRSPRKDTAEQLHYPPKTVEKILGDARKWDILTPTTAGKAGGELTALGNRLAQQHQAL